MINASIYKQILDKNHTKDVIVNFHTHMCFSSNIEVIICPLNEKPTC